MTVAQALAVVATLWTIGFPIQAVFLGYEVAQITREKPMTLNRHLADIAVNFRAIFKAMMLRRVSDQDMATGYVQVALSIAISWTAMIVSLMPNPSLITGIDQYETMFLAGHAFISLVALVFATLVIGAARQGASLIIGMHLSTPIIMGLVYAFGLVLGPEAPVAALVGAMLISLSPLPLFVFARLEGKFIWRGVRVLVFFW